MCLKLNQAQIGHPPENTLDGAHFSDRATSADLSTPLAIGPVRLAGRVLLAPMSGVTDLPFRRLAHRYGAGAVVCEMIASEHLAAERRDMMRRVEGAEMRPFIIQLAGRTPEWMAEGARIATDLGADIIDINMGCPAKQVTHGQSGSALMREPELAIAMIAATVKATDRPVTVKMRLGWDDRSLNAPALAKAAEREGAQAITVHGRTRCQFYKGRADWRKVRAVREAVRIPLIVNGDIGSIADVREAIAQSGADAAMVGRGAYGAPWLPGQLSQHLANGRDPGTPDYSERIALLTEHFELMLAHYGTHLGLRNARKHLGWTVAGLGLDAAIQAVWRARLCQDDDAASVRRSLADLARLGVGADLEVAA